MTDPGSLGRTDPGPLTLDGADLLADVGGTCAAATAEIRSAGARTVVCDLADVPPADLAGDLAGVDALARLCAAVERSGARLLLRGVPPGLQALIRLAGLTDVLAAEAPPSGRDVPAPRSDVPAPCSDVQVQRQAEGAEDVLPDEVRDAADAPLADLQQVHGPRHQPSGRAARLVLGEGR